MIAIAAIVGLFGLLLGYDAHTIVQRHNMTQEISEQNKQDWLTQWKKERDSGQLSQSDYDFLIRGWISNR
jgi:xanthosine utilization system XapX-like protein